MERKKFFCRECKKPITKKSDLAVVGNSFITYHNECFDSLKHKNTYAFYSGYKSNGWFPWVMLILLNVVLWSTYYLFNAPFEEVLFFSTFILAMTLFFRGMSYILYERFY
jgi:hypothetical protein